MPDRDSEDVPETAAPATAREPTHEPTGLEAARALAARYRSGQKRSRRSTRPARETQVSGAHPDGRDPAPLGAAVDKLVNDSGWVTDVAVRGVFARWPTIVGDEVAAHCSPQGFDEGKLVVQTDSTAWATQLKLLAPTLVRRLNEELGHGTVAQIVVQGPDTLSWRRGRRSVRDGRGPRDTYG